MTAATVSSFDFGSLIARAWVDEAFKARLALKPEEALAECGMTVPEGASLKIHINSPHEIHLVVPEPPETLQSTIESTAESKGGCWLPCRGNNSW